MDILVTAVGTYTGRVSLDELTEFIGPYEMSVCLVVLLLEQPENYGVVVGSSPTELNELTQT